MTALDLHLDRLDTGDWIRNGAIVAVTGGLLAVLLSKRLRGSDTWTATVTPLASIIGSGFLVVAPLLAFTAGSAAVFAMAALVGLAYLVGGAIRYNIRYLEEMIESGGEESPLLHWLERLAKLSLAFAYVISITFYTELLGAFLLRGVGVTDQTYQKMIATGVLALIGIVGRWRGLHLLERLETASVDTKLSIIGGLLLGLIVYNVHAVVEGTWSLPATTATWDTRTVRILLGTLLIVQGFETSRYLGDAYGPEKRIRTMRLAQLISAAIYLAFVALSTVLFGVFHEISETGIISMSDQIALVLPALLIVGAAMSQFSAAVADTVGSGGLVAEATAGHVSARNTYLVVAGLAIGLLWLTSIFEVIAWASRAFAVYYGVQTGMATLHAWRGYRGERRRGHAVLYALLTVLMVIIALFGVPAESASGKHG